MEPLVEMGIVLNSIPEKRKPITEIGTELWIATFPRNAAPTVVEGNSSVMNRASCCVGGIENAIGEPTGVPSSLRNIRVIVPEVGPAFTKALPTKQGTDHKRHNGEHKMRKKNRS